MSDFNGGEEWSPCTTCGWVIPEGDEWCMRCGVFVDAEPEPEPEPDAGQPRQAPAGFDASAGERALQAALVDVEHGADPEWQAAVWLALRAVIARAVEFTTDEVWLVLAERGVPAPREPRALGPIMRQAVMLGLAESTGAMKKSVRVGCHRRPVAVYRARATP